MDYVDANEQLLLNLQELENQSSQFNITETT